MSATQILKVYVEGSQGRWEAVCLDFDIAVQGQTLDEVMVSIKEAIALYLGRIAELPPKERASFLRRHAPRSVVFTAPTPS